MVDIFFPPKVKNSLTHLPISQIWISFILFLTALNIIIRALTTQDQPGDSLTSHPTTNPVHGTEQALKLFTQLGSY